MNKSCNLIIFKKTIVSIVLHITVDNELQYPILYISVGQWSGTVLFEFANHSVSGELRKVKQGRFWAMSTLFQAIANLRKWMR